MEVEGCKIEWRQRWRLGSFFEEAGTTFRAQHKPAVCEGGVAGGWEEAAAAAEAAAEAAAAETG